MESILNYIRMDFYFHKIHFEKGVKVYLLILLFKYQKPLVKKHNLDNFVALI